MLDLLVELNRRGGLTVVMVTHSAQAAGYGHRTIELADGRIVWDAAVSARPGPNLASDTDHL